MSAGPGLSPSFFFFVLFVLFFLIMLHPMSAILAIPLCVVVAAIPDVSQSLGMDSAVKCAEPFIFVAPGRGEPARTRRRQAGIGGENAARHPQSPWRWRIAVEIFVQAGDAAARTIACRTVAMAAATGASRSPAEA